MFFNIYFSPSTFVEDGPQPSPSGEGERSELPRAGILVEQRPRILRLVGDERSKSMPRERFFGGRAAL
jgi:hypothetical protein